MGRLLSEIFDSQTIKLNIEAKTKELAFAELIDAIAGLYPECDRDELFKAIMEREDKIDSKFANGVAIPHAHYNGIGKMVGAIGISKQGIDYGTLDKKPVHIVFLLVISKQVNENHLYILNQLLRVAQSEEVVSLKNAKNTEEIHEILSRMH